MQSLFIFVAVLGYLIVLNPMADIFVVVLTGSTNGNRSPYKPKMHQSTPQYSPVYSSTSSILSAVLSSDEGMPMDVSVASPVKQVNYCEFGFYFPAFVERF